MMRTLDPADCDRLVHGGVWSTLNYLIRSDHEEPILSIDELYRACVRTAHHVDGPGDVWFNFEVGDRLYNRQTDPTRPEQMPVAEDGSLVAYTDRMSRALGCKRFCLRVTDVHCYDVAVFRKLCRYLAPLIPRLREDPVPRLARTVLFVGDYAYTPVGAHIDSDPQFQYLIHGRRRAHIWTPERWNSRPRNSREAWRYIDEAETFDLGVGDAIYWPAGHYHVFESLGLSIAITFGFPEIAAPASAEEREALSGKHGFLNCPAPINPPALDRSARLCGQRDLPIVLLSTKVGSTQRVVSCNGFLIQLPALMDCTPIIARVNSGVPFTCNEVIAEVRTQVPASEVDDVTIDVLGAFVAAHALDVL